MVTFAGKKQVLTPRFYCKLNTVSSKILYVIVTVYLWAKRTPVNSKPTRYSPSVYI